MDQATLPYREGRPGDGPQPAAIGELAVRAADALVREATGPAASHLIVVPDGRLAYLPFEILPLPDDQVLADRLTVSYAPSLSTLIRLRARPVSSAPRTLVAFGDPVISQPGPAAVDRPGEEGRAGLGDARWGRRPRWRVTTPPRCCCPPGASSPRCREREPRPRPSRACSAPGAWRSSARITPPGGSGGGAASTASSTGPRTPCSTRSTRTSPAWSSHRRRARQPGGGAADDLVTVHDLARLSLRADLVVCSACQTGLGVVRAGEGTIGMAQALLAAGARCVVLSLWPVPDRPTRRLMLAFYQALRRGEPPADALRAAKAEVRRRYPRIYRSPFTWAAFVVIGDGSVPSAA